MAKDTDNHFVLEHVALDVADPVKTAAWWCENLGFEIVRQADDPAHTTFIADCTGRICLEIYRAVTLPQAPDYAGTDPLTLHIAFVSEDVDAEAARLQKAGATLESRTSSPGFEGAMLRDPSGIPIQLAKRENAILKKF